MTRQEMNAACKKLYEGKHYFTKNGKREFVVTEYRFYGDVDITFIPSGLKKNTKMGNILVGLPDPFEKSIVFFDTPQHEYEGCVYKNSLGQPYKIIKYQDYNHVTVKFLDDTGYEFTTTLQNVKKGEIKNPYSKNKLGGYLGEGNYCSNEFSNIYNIWHCILVRILDPELYNRNRQYTTNAYENCGICNEWMCYNTFADWYYNETKDLNYNVPYNIDKDILYYKYKYNTNGCKYYSDKTCIIVPHDINVSFITFSDEDKRSELNDEKYNRFLDKVYMYYNMNAMSEKTKDLILESINANLQNK